MFPDRVLLVHNHYRQPGGEDRVFTDELELLSRNGHDVIRFTADNSDLTGSGGLALAARAVWNADGHGRLTRLLRDKNPQLMHVHNTFPLLSPAVYYAARSRGTAVVQTLHNYRLLCPGATLFRNGEPCEKCHGKPLPWPGIIHGCYRGRRAASAVVATMLATHRLLRTWIRTIDVFVALSKFSRNKFIAAGIPAERVVVKPNFVHPDPGMGLGRGKYALFAGRLAPEKGLDVLLAAWSRVGRAMPIKIVGDGPMEAQVREAALRTGSVEVLGRKSHDEVMALMRDAGVLLLPSRCYEASPVVLAEAYAVGLPVIASDIGALSELVSHGRTGLLFRPGDAEDLAAKVEWLVAHPAEMRQMRHEARAEFLAKYTAERNYSALMEIYRRAIEGRGAVLEPQAAAAQAAGHAG
jgi:glycosyltransferase involved in cell wall biosynthesis